MGKYKKCPRCELNYIAADEEICTVCKDELSGKKSIFDEEEQLICPFCQRNCLTPQELMCPACRAKRERRTDEP